MPLRNARLQRENAATEVAVGDELLAAAGHPASCPGELLTLEEAAQYLGLHKDHKAPDHAVRYLCRTRKVRFLKVGKTLRFRREWLDAYIDSESIAPIRRTI